MSYADICRAQLPDDEGKRLKLYKDSLGIASIGIGRNLEAVGIRPDEMALMFENDLKDAIALAPKLVPQFESLSDNRKAVIVNMTFNMGEKLLGFKQMLAGIAAGDFNKAADEMLNSTWAKQVGLRASRLSKMMREG